MLLNNYFFLKQVTAAIETTLVGASFERCYQTSHSYVLCFSNGIHFSMYESDRGLIYKWQEEGDGLGSDKRSRVLPHLSALKGSVLQGIEVVELERIWVWKFTHHHLVFKLFGRRANLMLYPIGSDQAQEIFFKNRQHDYDESYTSITVSAQEKLVFPLNLSECKWIPQGLLNQLPEKTCLDWEQWTGVRGMLEAYLPVYEEKEWIWKSKIFISEVDWEQMLDYYWREVVIAERFSRLQTQAENRLRAEQKQLIKKRELHLERIFNLENERSKKEIADIIMAHLHAFGEGIRDLELEDFYLGGKLRVELPEGKTAVEYATQLYKKAPGVQVAIDHHKKQLKAVEDRLVLLEQEKEELHKVEKLRDLKKRVANQDREQSKQKEVASLPYKEYFCEGYRVLIGRNAKANDQLLRTESGKNDLWFHAKDVSGSHVIIKTGNAPHVILPRIIERVASWAAWYSKSRNQSTVAVMYTERKYVRKGKHLGPGMVIVDRSNTVLVRPQNPNE